MTAFIEPIEKRSVSTKQDATLHTFALFHLNLCYSSIEEAQRSDVIARSYWPLLSLARDGGFPIAIEATGYTLDTIATLDPLWIQTLRSLIRDGVVEFVGSGYAQMIGPLVPARMTEENLAAGTRAYEKHLGIRPRIALVNEQAYSSGLVPLYRKAGYDAILMDWDNCAAFHPDWDPLLRYYPQRARGVDGSEIGVLWTNTVAFQKLQRLAHGDIEQADYEAFLAKHIGREQRAFAIYGNDAECFDFRPGRFMTEERLHSEGEWVRIATALRAIRADGRIELATPSNILNLKDHPRANKLLTLETAENPIPVKKQPKYNVMRWSTTGRDNLGINTLCWRAYEALTAHATPAGDAAWQELAYLWSSDFRTHVTEARWNEYQRRLQTFVAIVESRAKPVNASPELILKTPESAGHSWRLLIADDSSPRTASISAAPRTSDRFIDINLPSLRARIDCRRGLAIHSLAFGSDQNAILGHLPHGYFDDIALSADWYTGNSVFEAPGAPKVTDLEWTQPQVTIDETTGTHTISGVIHTRLGPITKTLTFHADEPRIDFDLEFDWQSWGRGALRLGHFTLLPEAFEWPKLVCRTHNGGQRPETYSLLDHSIDHGAPVSFLVSASSALGLTEGWCEVEDGTRGFRVTVDKSTSALVGLLIHKRVGRSLFCQLMLSAMEMDDTRNPDTRATKRRFKFSLTTTSPQ